MSLVALPGCGKDEPLVPPGGGPVPAGGGEPGEAVAVTGQSVQVGFAVGHMRKSADVEGFRISRHPITLREFRACVSAGRCEAPREAACSSSTLVNFKNESLPEDSPISCAGISGARQYCTWVGGTLPTLEQWLLAARGPSPQRYPWGETAAKCEQHAYGMPAERQITSRCPQPLVDIGRIGQHPAGASVFGVQDVLLLPGELLDVSADALFPACEKRDAANGKNLRACVVHGLEPGSIDSVYELDATPERPDTSIDPYGFRCVWGGAS